MWRPIKHNEYMFYNIILLDSWSNTWRFHAFAIKTHFNCVSHRWIGFVDFYRSLYVFILGWSKLQYTLYQIDAHWPTTSSHHTLSPPIDGPKFYWYTQRLLPRFLPWQTTINWLKVTSSLHTHMYYYLMQIYNPFREYYKFNWEQIYNSKVSCLAFLWAKVLGCKYMICQGFICNRTDKGSKSISADVWAPCDFLPRDVAGHHVQPQSPFISIDTYISFMISWSMM